MRGRDAGHRVGVRPSGRCDGGRRDIRGGAAGVRGVVSVPVSQVYSEHSFSGASLVQASSASTGSDYNWSKTLGISAAALALALSLGGLAAVGMRHRKAPLGV